MIDFCLYCGQAICICKINFARKRDTRWSGSMEAVPTTQTGECLSGRRQIPLR